MASRQVELFKSFQPFKRSSLTLPRVTGENKRGGFSGLNVLNRLNGIHSDLRK